MKQHLRAPKLWVIFFVLWAATLYTLSSFSKTLPDGTPEIPYLDKILHFGFFFGGGLILGTAFLLRKNAPTPAIIRIGIPLLILSIIGVLDEYHQTFTPGRSGNDPFDWLADFAGSATGLFIANFIHPLLLKFSSTVTEISEN